MGRVRELLKRFHSSDGRVKARTATGVLALAAAVALAIGVMPALAGEGADSTREVTPELVSYGGGSGACAQFGSPTAQYELHINNPMSTVYTGPDGSKVELRVYASDTLFDYWFLDSDGNRVNDMVFTADPDVDVGAYDVIVNGGAKNTHYDNLAQTGVIQWDKELHAPTKGQSSFFKLSHINICYGEQPVDFVCDVDETRFEEDGIFAVARTVIFENNLFDCLPKQGFYSINNDAPTPNVRLDFDVSGTGGDISAGKIELTKEFSGPSVYVPLRYSVTSTGTVSDVSWCDVREKVGDDGDQFDDYLDPTEYPSLVGVRDAIFTTTDAIACKVAEIENAAGVQLTVVYFQFVDPQFK